jgi:hypothetical protein
MIPFLKITPESARRMWESHPNSFIWHDIKYLVGEIIIPKKVFGPINMKKGYTLSELLKGIVLPHLPVSKVRH